MIRLINKSALFRNEVDSQVLQNLFDIIKYYIEQLKLHKPKPRKKKLKDPDKN